MTKENILSQVASMGIVPVIAIEKVEHALPLADALIAGGLPVIEVTFRTAAAAEVIRLLAEERPQLIVGAGTVLTGENLKTAKMCGAKFAVSPGLNPNIVRQAREIGMPFAPGIATPSDIELALAEGCTFLKFFPAEALGGVPMIEALSAPYQHTGVKFMPTGGVSMANLESYLRVKTVATVGGTWVAKKEDFAAGQWSAITERCRSGREVVKKVRGT